MELILIRHGLPNHVVTNDGTPADPPLSLIGHQQSKLMAEWLETSALDRLYSSPMVRAMETAAPLSALKGIEIETRAGVAEYDQKASHYIPVEQLKEQDYERWREMMTGNVVGVDFPAFCNTVIATLNSIISENPGRRVAVVCHGGVINAWSAHVMGFEPRMFFNPNYTSISRYMAAGSGERSIVTLNEHTHLAGLK